jgi:hypothetical protein
MKLTIEQRAERFASRFYPKYLDQSKHPGWLTLYLNARWRLRGRR